jgi:hypothetical protein
MAAAHMASRHTRDSRWECGRSWTHPEHPSVNCTLGWAVIHSLGASATERELATPAAGQFERGPAQSPADVPAGGRHSGVERDVFAFCPAQATSIGRLARLNLGPTRRRPWTSAQHYWPNENVRLCSHARRRPVPVATSRSTSVKVGVATPGVEPERAASGVVQHQSGRRSPGVLRLDQSVVAPKGDAFGPNVPGDGVKFGDR